MKYTLLLAVLFCTASGCKKETGAVATSKETNILNYSIKNTAADIAINALEHQLNIRFPDTIMQAEDLVATFTLSPGCKATVKNVEQVSGSSKNNYSNTIYYTISTQGSSSDWKVVSTNNNFTAALGLGNFLQQKASNECSYSWYYDQAYTGLYSYENCGPSAVTMVCKWSDPEYSKTPEQARMAYRSTGGDWYPDDITFYLRDNHVPNSTLALPADFDGVVQTLRRQVDLHQLSILCLEINTVRFNENPKIHTDRFFATKPGLGHFVIVKGYRKVDNQLFFEVYDPNSFTATYDDGTLKGKDRYYRAEDLYAATKSWWPKIFIVAKKGNTVVE